MKRPLIYAFAALCCAILLAGFGAPFFLYVLLPVALLPLPLIFKKVRPVSVVLVLAVYILGCAAAIPVFGNENPFEDFWDHSVALSGMVDSVPSHEGEKTRFVLKLQEINHMPVSGKVMVTVAENSVNYTPGAALSFDGEISEPAGRRNPGGFDYALYLKAKGIGGQVYLKNREAVTVKPGSSSPIYAVYRMRQHLSEVCDQFFTPPQSGLIKGILLGASTMDDEVKASFREAGVSHVLAISGVKTLKLDIPLVPETRIKWALMPLHIAKIYILKLCLDEEIIPRCRFPCSRGYLTKCINQQKKQ